MGGLLKISVVATNTQGYIVRSDVRSDSRNDSRNVTSNG